MQHKITTAISGGGAKGVGIPGTQFAFQLLGYKSDHIIGTSVGGITGLFSLLLYDNFTDYIKLLNVNDFQQLVNAYFGKFQGDAKPLEALMNQTMKVSYDKKLSNIQDEELSHLTKQEWIRFKKIQKQVTNSETVDPGITFADHAIIKKVIPDFPDLTVVAIRADTNADYVFSSLEQTKALQVWIDEQINSFELAEIFRKEFNLLSDSEKSQVQELYQSIVTLTEEVYLEIRKDFNFRAVPSKAHYNELKAIQAAYKKHSGAYHFSTNDLTTIKIIDPIKKFFQNDKGEIFLDIKMVDGVIASASLPIVLKQRMIEAIPFKDGGLHNNMPSDLAEGDNTYLIAFDRKGLIALYDDANATVELATVRRWLAKILYILGLIKDRPEFLTKVFNQDLQKVVQGTRQGHSIVCNTNGIDTTHFKRAKQQEKELFLRFFFDTMIDWKIKLYKVSEGTSIQVTEQKSLKLLNFIFRTLDNNQFINKKPGSAYQQTINYLYRAILYNEDQKTCRSDLSALPSSSDISATINNLSKKDKTLHNILFAAVRDKQAKSRKTNDDEKTAFPLFQVMQSETRNSNNIIYNKKQKSCIQHCSFIQYYRKNSRAREIIKIT
jgi:predicted acylesterase/phospholipase RssA